ncbi:MAG: LysR family transcriptional regulator [Ruminococcaceae bacterium]|nr:LysR family transcriptional regulator [Oscillospiraceae bacterium]
MELLQLKYFQCAAKKENISHAAQIFMVPPSSVSASIKKLETELGVTLFDRTANTLKLNANGKIFLRAIDAADKEIKKAKTEMLDLAQMPFGEITLLILTNRRIVTDMISKFKKEYPEVSFSIKHDDYGDYAAYHKYDIVITDREIESVQFECKEFIREEIFLAVPKQSLLSDLEQINLKQLRETALICMPKGSSIRGCMDRYCKQYDVEPNIVIECDDPYYVCEYLKMGLGSAFFPSVSWNKQVDDKIKLLKINEGLYRHSYLYVNKESTNVAKLFANQLEMERM